MGLCLFEMKGVAPKGVAPKGITMMDIYKSMIPFILIDFTAMLMILFFPSIALVLPSLMRY
jgi:TRAP-type mannitol/chloroaromatic compound transport system permease large subunit